MSQENSTGPQGDQAVPSLGARGSDDFASFVSDGGKGGSQSQTTTSSSTAVAGTNEKPELVTETPKKSADSGQQQQTQAGNQQQGQQTQQSQQAAPAGTMDKATLDQIVETATRAAASATQQGQQAGAARVARDQEQMTEAQFNAKYGITPVTDAHMQAILDADPKKGAFMLNQILVKQLGSAALMAKDIVDVHLKQMREQFQPHVDSWTKYQSEQRERALETSFYETNKDLTNEKPLVKEMQDAIFGRIASGQLKPFNTPQDALKAVADATRAVLVRMGRQTGAAGASAQQSQQQNQSSQGQQSSGRQMTAALSAGQSGTGQAAGKSDEEKIFGNDFV